MFNLFKYFLLRSFIAWLIIFAIFKGLFLLFHFYKFSSESFFEILSVFSKSLKLDISAVSYLLIIPFFLLIIQYFVHSGFIKKSYKYYLLFFALGISLINVADIFLYDAWSSKISLKSLSFLNMPDQVIATMGAMNVLMALLFILFHFVLAFSILNKFIFNKKLSFKKNIFKLLIYSLASIILLISGIRGGFQNIPINQSSTYFSNNNTLNIAGVNPFWNFMNTLVQNRKYLNENPYKKLESKKAKGYVKELYSIKKDTTIRLFDIEKPNIVFIALEGVNANVFESFGAKKSFAPSLDSLFQYGYLFKEMYSAGFRSDQGMVAIYSGFPPTPVSSIAAQPEKFMKLPSMTKELMQNNYNCSYFMGVEPEFGNLKSYLVYNGFDKLIDIKDFPEEQKTSSLGVPDEYLFDKFLDEMQSILEPFYSMIFTATTHEPFDMPFNKGVMEERVRYLNTVAYIDSVLVDFINSAKLMPWYENTIFVISSDHAHSHPNNYFFDANERYHIPFFVFGEPLKNEFIGKENNAISSQIDIPKTILKQLDLDSEKFSWSKNMMNPYSNEFAFYTYVEGYVLKTDQCNIGWEYRYDKPVGQFNTVDSTICQEEGQAFLQELYETYLNY